MNLYNKGFLPFRRGPGYDVECIPLLGAIKESSTKSQESWQMIQVKAPGSNQEIWYAQFLCVAVVKGRAKVEGIFQDINDSRAIIQWYQVAPRSERNNDPITRYTLYEIERTTQRVAIPADGDASRVVNRQMNFVDSCRFKDILKPVFFQLHPGYVKKKRKRYYLNTDV